LEARVRSSSGLSVVFSVVVVACGSSSSQPAPADGDGGSGAEAGPPVQTPAEAGSADAAASGDGAPSNGPPNGTTCAEAAAHLFASPCADENLTESSWAASCASGQSQCTADGLGAEFQSYLGCIARSPVSCITGIGYYVQCTGLPTANCWQK
jgi:hypothetical protein